jgi:CheY-like chemotaxis protein
VSTRLLAILVIDDEFLFREFLLDALESLGYAATAAADSEEAFRILATTPSITVVLCDVTLEHETGPQIIRHALKIRQNLKVMFMTGGAETLPVRRTDPILHKPFTIEELALALVQLIEAGEPRFEGWPSNLERRRQHIG